MDVRVVTDAEAMAAEGARLVAEVIRHVPDAVLLVATGETPIGLYRELGRLSAAGAVDLRSIRLVQLDEYAGVSLDDRRSLYGWMLRDVAGPLGVDPARITRLAGDAPDPLAACAAYDAEVAELGGIDVAILGLGPNGHLGFNEPPSPADAPTRPVRLTPESIESNARYWGSHADVPRVALTCGMATILAARRVLLVVSGGRKREIVERLRLETPSPDLPASLLWSHDAATLLVDREAMPPGTPA